MTSNSCCCKTVMFDGGCFDTEKNLIAFCVQSINETAAMCYENADRDGDSFVCGIGDACPTIPLISSKRFIIYVGIFVGGCIGLILAVSLICSLCLAYVICMEKKEQNRPGTEIKSPQSEDERCENPKMNALARSIAFQTDDEGHKGKIETPEGEDANLKSEDEGRKSEAQSPEVEDEGRKSEDESPEGENEGRKSEDESPEGEGEGREKIKYPLSSFFMAIMVCEFVILGGIVEYYETTLIIIGAIVLIGGIASIGFQYQRMKKPLDDEWSREHCARDPAILETVPSDMYDDITSPFDTVSLLFVCQVTLLGNYIYAIYAAGSPDFSSPEAYFFYTMGALVQISYQLAKGGFLKQYFDFADKLADKKGTIGDLFALQDVFALPEHWENISNARTDEGVHIKDNDSKSERLIGNRSLVARRMMSNVVNGLGTTLLFFLLPVHLSHSSDAIDFVLNVTAAYFIVELDDNRTTEKILLCIKTGGKRDGDASEQSCKDGEEETEDNGAKKERMASPPAMPQVPPDADPPNDEHEDEHQAEDKRKGEQDGNEEEEQEKLFEEKASSDNALCSRGEEMVEEPVDRGTNPKVTAQTSDDDEASDAAAAPRLEIKSGGVEHETSQILPSVAAPEAPDPEA